MAVFTQVEEKDIKSFLEEFSIGDFISLEGISGGIENTNYFLKTSKDTYVLTIFERLGFNELPFYLDLMQHLSNNNIKVPLPISSNKGNILHKLCFKPCSIVTKLAGKSILTPNSEHISQIATEMAKMHLTSNKFNHFQPNLRSFDWWNRVIPDIEKYYKNPLLVEELKFLMNFFYSKMYQDLPQGISHCDLFRDNALFENNKLGGIFDFYFAGIDKFLFDICVTINDWCIDFETKAINLSLLHTFIDSYNSVRKLTKHEILAMPIMLRASAFRFWVSRLWDWYLPRKSSLLTPHDPTHFEKILIDRINNAQSYQYYPS